MYDLATFGEAMIRLSTPDYQRLEQATTLVVTVGGAEFNVAVNASSLGLKSAWVSRLVDNWSGRYIRNKGREQGVDMSHILWTKFDGVGYERNGFYHLETGVGPRASSVTYDRGHSAISHIQPGMVDWEGIFKNTKWLHVSGITPALSKSAAETTLECLKVARKCSVTTSFDLNYRSKLWTPEEAQETIKQLVPYICVLIGNEEDFEKSLGLEAEGTSESYDKLDPESYKEVARSVVELYPNVEKVGTTLRVAKTGLLNDWRTLLFDGKEFYLSRKYADLELVDRVGGGDSFSAGLVYSILKGKGPQEAVEFAGGFSALAHTFPGDFNWATEAEVEKVMAGAAARISR